MAALAEAAEGVDGELDMLRAKARNLTGRARHERSDSAGPVSPVRPRNTMLVSKVSPNSPGGFDRPQWP
jgi:hypothetical protein